MAKDPRKHQKKLQRQRAKEKAKRKAIAERNSPDMAKRMQRAAHERFLHCCTTTGLFDEGIGNVLVSRELGNGAVAFAAFLVDMYCLGVKDVAMGVTTRGDYDGRIYTKTAREFEIVKLEPAAAKKLIEGAVEYAKEAGFPPHRDYRKAKPIFGDVDATACAEEFTYGKEGKPFFFAGPYDSSTRCRQIISTLTNRFGPDGFDYVVIASNMASAPSAANVLGLEDLDEYEFIDE
jgi:hypothetical protein